jgi:hypothetical protein
MPLYIGIALNSRDNAGDGCRSDADACVLSSTAEGVGLDGRLGDLIDGIGLLELSLGELPSFITSPFRKILDKVMGRN